MKIKSPPVWEGNFKKGGTMEYTFSTRMKNGSVCLILAYKIGKKWKQKTKQGFRTQREARAYQTELLRQAEKEAGLTFDPTLKDISLRQFWPIFKRDREAELSYTSIQSYRACLKRMDPILDTPIKDLAMPMILNQLNALPVAVATRNLTLRALKIILQHAVMYKIIPENPARIIKQISSREKQPLNAFTVKEVSEILAHFQGRKNRAHYLVLLIAARTGLRIGEILGLTWEAIDFRRNQLRVTQQWGQIGRGKYGLKPCKTANSVRAVPAPAEVMDELRKYKQRTPLQLNGLVFSPKGMHALTVNLNLWLRKHYGRSLHSFRHTFATLLLSRTGDINLVASVLGDTVAIVSKTYVNYTQDIRDKAAESIADLYSFA